MLPITARPIAFPLLLGIWPRNVDRYVRSSTQEAAGASLLASRLACGKQARRIQNQNDSVTTCPILAGALLAHSLTAV